MSKKSYKPEYVSQAEKLAALGLTDAEIATFFGVAARTLHRWKINYPEFAESLTEGKRMPDERVRQKLYQRAVGYEIVSEKLFAYQGVVTRAKIVEHIPGDVTAQIFWLKNRQPDEWRDRRGEDGDTAPPLVDPDPDCK